MKDSGARLQSGEAFIWINEGDGPVGGLFFKPEALAFQEALLRSLSAGIIILDARGRVLRINPAFVYMAATPTP